MKGDPRLELRGAVMVGRRTDPKSPGSSDEQVTVVGLTLSIGPDGLTVESRDSTAAHTVKWERVKAVAVGSEATFADGARARSIDVLLDDRSVQFLVPYESLPDTEIQLIREIVGRNTGSAFAIPDPRPTEMVPKPAPLKAAGRDVRKRAAPKPKASPLEPRQTGRLGKLIPLAIRTRTPTTNSVVLPPPPPDHSRMSMPPRPSDADGSRPAPTMDPSLLTPLAVPFATRVPDPRPVAETPTPAPIEHAPVEPRAEVGPVEEIPTFDPSILSESRRRLPAMPPPPPVGSGVRLPPPVAASTRPDTAMQESPFVPVAPMPPGDVAPPVPPAAEMLPPPAEKPERAPDAAAGHRKPRRRRSRTLPLLSIVAILIAAGIAGAVFGLTTTSRGHGAAGTPTVPTVATRGLSGGPDSSSTTPPVSSDGPSPGTTLASVAAALNLSMADFPAGWKDGPAPWSRVAESQANDSLAGCLGIREKDLGLILGIQQPTGPPLLSSGWFDSTAPAQTGFETSVVMTGDAGRQVSDISAFGSSDAASCLQGWFASLDVAHDPIINAPTMSSLPLDLPSGEHGSGFESSVTTRIGSTQKTVDEELFVLGDGRIESALVCESVGAPVNASSVSTQLHDLESRLTSAVSS
ncbi:MAG: hypothetical protein WAM97_14700 [Acidimicrobiales bacterium]